MLGLAASEFISTFKEGLAANSFEVMLQNYNVFQYGTLQVLNAIY